MNTKRKNEKKNHCKTELSELKWQHAQYTLNSYANVVYANFYSIYVCSAKWNYKMAAKYTF